MGAKQRHFFAVSQSLARVCLGCLERPTWAVLSLAHTRMCQECAPGPRAATPPQALQRHLLATDATGAPAHDLYDGAYVYDLFQPAARAYAWEAVEAGYVRPYGLQYWWLDCDEPCGGDPSNLVYNNGTWSAPSARPHAPPAPSNRGWFLAARTLNAIRAAASR